MGILEFLFGKKPTLKSKKVTFSAFAASPAFATSQDAFEAICEKDSKPSPRPFPRTIIEPVLPPWFDRSTHESMMLIQALNNLDAAMGTRRNDDALIDTVVICEFVAGSHVLAGASDMPATQQIADAWFHKALIFFRIASGFDDKPTTAKIYVSAASNCVNIALSHPAFVQPTFEQLKNAISAAALKNIRGRFGL